MANGCTVNIMALCRLGTRGHVLVTCCAVTWVHLRLKGCSFATSTIDWIRLRQQRQLFGRSIAGLSGDALCRCRCRLRVVHTVFISGWCVRCSPSGRERLIPPLHASPYHIAALLSTLHVLSSAWLSEASLWL